ncbi:hypothetical protein TNCV_817571 [Trichonephila clavipes]|nr:hypothetical protein TNCV_817571 [Trichonephila clavipes]
MIYTSQQSQSLLQKHRGVYKDKNIPCTDHQASASVMVDSLDTGGHLAVLSIYSRQTFIWSEVLQKSKFSTIEKNQRI